MLAGVWDRAPKPSMQLRPSHQALEIGARFGEPSSFIELTRTTGVPKYRMAGSIVRCTREGMTGFIVDMPRRARRPGWFPRRADRTANEHRCRRPSPARSGARGPGFAPL